MKETKELSPEVIEKLKAFKWKYIEHITGDAYLLQKASEFENIKITVIDKTKICFWHDDAHDGATCIYLKNILLF